MSDILKNLGEVLEQRKIADSGKSYVASLHEKGLNKILEKVGEEAIEAILAAKDYDSTGSEEQKQAVINETADLWFHSLVMLSNLGLSPENVLDELEKRFSMSGLTEKASRSG